jgi:hypothetical protein
MADKVAEGARLSAQGHDNGKLVEFEQDVFPHVAGDVKRLNSAELKRVDEVAKSRKLSGKVYVERSLTSDEKAAVKKDEEAAPTSPEDTSTS